MLTCLLLLWKWKRKKFNEKKFNFFLDLSWSRKKVSGAIRIWFFMTCRNFHGNESEIIHGLVIITLISNRKQTWGRRKNLAANFQTGLKTCRCLDHISRGFISIFQAVSKKFMQSQTLSISHIASVLLTLSWIGADIRDKSHRTQNYINSSSLNRCWTWFFLNYRERNEILFFLQELSMLFFNVLKNLKFTKLCGIKDKHETPFSTLFSYRSIF